MYYVTHPDDTKETLRFWSEVEPLFDRYNIENAASLSRLLSPETVARAAKEDGGSAWQDNGFDECDADGDYTGRFLVIEGEEDRAGSTPEAGVAPDFRLRSGVDG